MKRRGILVAAALLALSGTIMYYGNFSGEALQQTERVGKPVQVEKVEVTVNREALDYIGVVEPEKYKQISSKYNGKVDQVHIKKGDTIQKGQVLITMEQKDHQLELVAAQADVDASTAQLRKVKSALDYSNENLDRMRTLYESGALAEQQYDLMVMENQTLQSDYQSAEELVNKAQANWSYKSNVLSDTKIRADIEGHVVEVLYKEGENIAAGYPIVVVRGNTYVMHVGVSQKDISKISLETEVQVILNHGSISGQITNIGQVPNQETRTYPVEVLLHTEDTQLGAIGKVDFLLGQTQGIKIPINTLFSGEEDFVYTVVDGIVVKKVVRLEEVDEKYVYVQGLVSGDQLIVRGMKRVKPGESVTVVMQ